MEDTIEQQAMRSTAAHLIEKARAAMELKDLKNAVSSASVAKTILEDLAGAGATIDEDELAGIAAMLATARQAIALDGMKVKERTVSQLAALRASGTKQEASGKQAKILPVFLFGLDAAGKTTLVDHVINERFLDHAPTIGASISRITLGSLKFVFNDVGGQQRYREKWRDYWHGPEMLVFVIDAADHERFDQAAAYLRDVLGDPASAGIPLAVLANKMDKTGARSLGSIVAALDLATVKASGRLVAAFDTSIKENRNVDKALTFIASTALGDAALRQFVDAEVARVNKNLGEMYKAYIREAKQLEKAGDVQAAIARVSRAKLVQDELFKQGFSKAVKEIDTCTRWLAKLRKAA